MNRIKVLLSVPLLFVGAFLISGCGTQADKTGIPKFPFPRHASNQFASSPMFPTSQSRAEMDGMTMELFLNILRNDLIVDLSGSQTKEDFRLVLRSFQEGEGSSHITTSETQGYGMVILAYMAGSENRLGLAPNEWLFGSTGIKDYYDAMLRTVLAFPSITPDSDLFTSRLLGFQDADAKGGYKEENGIKVAPFVLDSEFGYSITDGDMDIIYSLILADRQWGSKGRYDYLGIARDRLASLWNNCVHEDYNFILAGDGVKTTGNALYKSVTRTSDLMIAHLKAFKDVDPTHEWDAVIDVSYNAIREIRDAQNAAGNTNGLLPDILVYGSSGWEIPSRNIFGETDDSFGFFAFKAPWRLGTAYMLYGNEAIGDSTLYDYVIKPLDDFARSFTGGTNLSSLGFMNMDGTLVWAEPNLFVPSFAVTAAAAKADQQWVDAFWTYTPENEYAFQGLNAYQGDTFGDYIRMIVLLTITGNYWIP